MKNNLNFLTNDPIKLEDPTKNFIKDLEWTKNYFNNNSNIKEIKIGKELNDRYLKRQENKIKESPLIDKRFEPFTEHIYPSTLYITEEQLNKYKNTPLQDDALNILRMEFAKGLNGDKNILTEAQKRRAEHISHIFDHYMNKTPYEKNGGTIFSKDALDTLIRLKNIIK